MTIQLEEHQPTITIITSTYNADKELSITAASIRNQTYKNIQWIIIDGNSKDGTVELIKQNKDIVNFWSSEKDTGIYDAWNKGLKQIKGDWVVFIGAGDELYSSTTLETMSRHLKKAYPTYNLVYGDVTVLDENAKPVAKWGKPWEVLENEYETTRKALPPHPSSFIHSTFFKDTRYKFPGYLKIAGDSHLLFSLIKEKKPLYVPLSIDKMLFGGVSTSPKNLLLILKELKMLNDEFEYKIPFFTYLKNSFVVYLKAIISYIVSPKLFEFMYNTFLNFKYHFKKNKKH